MRIITMTKADYVPVELYQQQQEMIEDLRREILATRSTAKTANAVNASLSSLVQTLQDLNQVQQETISSLERLLSQAEADRNPITEETSKQMMDAIEVLLNELSLPKVARDLGLAITAAGGVLSTAKQELDDHENETN